MAAINNEQFVQSLKDRGFNTTKTGAKEANFENYGNALSTDLQKRIIDSFDSEADYALQARIASGFGKKSVLKKGEFMKMCKSMGLEINCESVNTSYIVDNKKGGKYANNTNATNGRINVYTIKDPSTGAEIVIADANGNAAIEMEELFINEVLTGVTQSIGNSGQAYSGGSSSVESGAGTASGVAGAQGANLETEANSKVSMSKEVFNEKVKQYQAKYDCSLLIAQKEVCKQMGIEFSAISALK